MSIDLARALAGALGITSESKIRQIDRALTAYARLTAQSAVTPISGSITEAQISDLQSYLVDGANQTTVGSAGAADALPANPTGYIQIGAGRVIPYYDET